MKNPCNAEFDGKLEKTGSCREIGILSEIVESLVCKGGKDILG